MSAAVLTRKHRRGKTAWFLLACCFAGIAPHFFEPTSSLFPSISLAFFLGGYGLLTVLREPNRTGSNQKLDKLDLLVDSELPSVDVLVAARDEEAVITRLVERIHALRYPEGKLGIWIIDDGSKDQTPVLLKELSKTFPRLNIIQRSITQGGGKSGALNSALCQTKAEWLFILDADAQFEADVLIRLISYAKRGQWSAVQLRKAVLNPFKNFLTQFQAMEMAMDAVIQQGRLSGEGVVELRGNGQLLERETVEYCGGFNEDTVTDDLDLSFRLLINQSHIGILWDPPVQEEAVDSLLSLWRQRQRWAEGGLQRFFDYWPILLSNKLTISQRQDLTCFFLLQYVLPVVSFVDLIATLLTKTIPTYWPLSFVAFSVSGLAYFRGCRKISEGPLLPYPNFIRLLSAIIYLSHWFVIIPWVTFKMAVFPKKLVWLKTTHHG